MKTLSLVTFSSNEADILERGYQSIYDVVDEIIYVDTGSKDSSIEIAKKYGAKIYNFEWIDDFSSASNFAHSKATSDYSIMWDSDFVLDKNSKEKILKLKSDNFHDADQVSVRWGLEYSDNEQTDLQKFIYRGIINKTGAFKVKNRVHIDFVFNKKNIKKVNTDILVHHIQKLSNKNNRKEQNINLTLEDIKDNPEDYTLLLALSGTYIYIKDYENALTQLEKFFTFKNLDYFKKLGGLENMLKCCIALNKIDYCFNLFGKYYDEYKLEPAYILLCADLMYFIDKRESLNLYIEYIRVRHKNGIHETDIFRNTKHPESMIEKIKSEISL